jgi:hypothetical protein
VAKLSEEEARTLEALQKKAKAPDAPAVARSVNISVDLADEAQVERAVKLGLPGFDALVSSNGDDSDDGGDDDDGASGGDDDDDDHEPPRRRAFFGDS